MPATLDDLRAYLDARKVNYYLHPDNRALLLPYRMSHRFSAKLLVRLERGGRFLIIRCDDFPMVDGAHPMIGELQQCLLAMNLTKRFVKLSHDPTDGEISMTGEVWIEDMEFTQAAFDRCMSNFLECLKEAGEAVDSVLAGQGMPESEVRMFRPDGAAGSETEADQGDSDDRDADDGESGGQARDAA